MSFGSRECNMRAMIPAINPAQGAKINQSVIYSNISNEGGVPEFCVKTKAITIRMSEIGKTREIHESVADNIFFLGISPEGSWLIIFL